MNGLSKWKLTFYLAGIFLAGGVSGWVVATKLAKEKAFQAPQPKEIAVSLRDRLHSRLNLTPEQGQQIDAIIERSSADMQTLHAENLRRIKQAVSSRNAQINGVLTPEQRAEFEQIEKERKELWRAKRSGNDPKHSSREKSGTNSPKAASP